MNKERAKEKYKKLPSKRRQVLLGVAGGDSDEKIQCELGISKNALQAHLKKLYKDFEIDTVWNDADDRRSGQRKRPLLVALIRDAIPELFSNSPPRVTKKRQDWGGNAPDVSDFFGRTEELAKLEQWIVRDRCRLVVIVGMAGIGKTSLSVKLGKGGIGKTDLSLKLARL